MVDNVSGYKIKIIDDSYQDFLATLANADLILTPTRRLATRLNQDFANWQVTQKKRTWQVDIISLNGWLERLWQSHQDNLHTPYTLRLSTWQNQIVWQKILNEVMQQPLLSQSSAASLAQQAWDLLKEWNMNWKDIDKTQASDDVLVFLSACEQYEKRCIKENFSDLISHIPNMNIQPIRKIYLIGFTQVSPAVTQLLKKLCANGTTIEIQHYRQKSTVYQAPQHNTQSELIQAALWAKSLLEQKPNMPIGIIVPDLSQHFAEVDAIFSQILMPQSMLAQYYQEQKPYNISSGKKLAEYPIISMVFEILKPTEKENLLPSQWSETIKQILQEHGWPGPRILSSLEYQLVQRFYELLTEFATLDIVHKPLSFTSACYLLLQQAQTMLFQGESEHAPLQILGALEGEGMHFAALWVTGLHADNWPQACNPHPFIPIDLQRKRNMPHASNEREYMFAQHLTKSFTQQASQVILSYPQTQEGRALMPSQLIAEYPLYNKEFPLPQLFNDSHLKLETWQEQPVPYKGVGIISGGVGLLQSQSACPFQAFARFRLKAKACEPIQKGLTHSQRGQLVHSALEFFWKTMQGTTQLKQHSHIELQEKIEQAITNAISQFPLNDLSHMHITLEENRLKELLMQWIEIEKTRPDFTVIHTEKSIQIHLSNLTINARIDRIDQLDSNEILLIDYKTGKANTTNWLDERPQQIQLPLYAIAHKNHGVALAMIRANEHKIIHLHDAQTQKDFNMSWNEVLSHWQRVLSRLADEFYEGNANVDPADDLACQHCDLELLCRIRSQ